MNGRGTVASAGVRATEPGSFGKGGKSGFQPPRAARGSGTEARDEVGPREAQVGSTAAGAIDELHPHVGQEQISRVVRLQNEGHRRQKAGPCTCTCNPSTYPAVSAGLTAAR